MLEASRRHAVCAEEVAAYIEDTERWGVRELHGEGGYALGSGDITPGREGPSDVEHWPAMPAAKSRRPRRCGSADVETLPQLFSARTAAPARPTLLQLTCRLRRHGTTV
jgi:hypothetical protein